MNPSATLEPQTRKPVSTPTLQSQSEKQPTHNLCVPQLVQKQAAQTPQRNAVVGDSLSLTYTELDHRANQLANYLRILGVKPEARVGLCMSRSPLNVVAALAVLKAGGAYVPMDPTYPRERLTFILEDADIAVLLTETTVAKVLPSGDWRQVMLDGDLTVIANYPAVAPPCRTAPEDLAYVIYTSGSTGTPKGVEITHANLLNLVHWHQNAFALVVDDNATQLASFGFDAAVWELWPYLTAGAAVHITPDAVRNSPELLRDWLVAEQISISFVPTPLAERVMLLEWPANTKLRLLLTGADTLHHYPRPGLPFQLINNYGPTEATVVATSGLIPPTSCADRRPSIGRPIDNTQVYICDESLNLVPTGEAGEIYIGGAGVARGYINSPELTARKFLPDPFSKKPGTRLYKTGDLGRLLPDGQLAYVGRVDGFVKIRGFRVEPNEIVSVLNTHAAVQASAVVARPDATGNLRLLGYVVSRGHAQTTSGSLRALVRKHLPDYMVPAIFVGVGSLPLTPNGKIDRDALPEPDATNTLPDENYAAPRTTLEEKLASIVANLLGVQRVGVEDNFFLIGGHSLFGAQLIASIQDSFGVELSLASIFDLPTPAELAREIERLIMAKLDSMSEDEIRGALQQANSAMGSNCRLSV
jgi:amino acid adenylation domain-containing protein